MLGLEARLLSGSEWFDTLRGYKTEKARRIALDALMSKGDRRFEYRIPKDS